MATRKSFSQRVIETFAIKTKFRELFQDLLIEAIELERSGTRDYLVILLDAILADSNDLNRHAVVAWFEIVGITVEFNSKFTEYKLVRVKKFWNQDPDSLDMALTLAYRTKWYSLGQDKNNPFKMPKGSVKGLAKELARLSLAGVVEIDLQEIMNNLRVAIIEEQESAGKWVDDNMTNIEEWKARKESVKNSLGPVLSTNKSTQQISKGIEAVSILKTESTPKKSKKTTKTLNPGQSTGTDG